MSAATGSSPHNTLTAEVVIVGGGLVGLTLGLSLGGAGIDTIVLDAADPAEVLKARFDGRVSAIAYASGRMLKTLGLRDELEGKAAAINDILVCDGSLRSGAAPLMLHFDHREVGASPLGEIIENRHLRMAQWALVPRTPALRVLAPVSVGDVTLGPAAMEITLRSGQRIRAPLLVAADGRDSALRSRFAIKTAAWSYDQVGIVATIAHERPHEGVAHELFLASGPFAILPMTGNRSSIVWTERKAASSAFLKLGDADFAVEVAKRFGDHWGSIKPEGPRWSYPLSLHLATRYVAERFVLAGDAAHGIHPIAGQGLNLGLRDCAALAEVLIEAKRLGLDLGSAAVLERYQRWRRFDNMALAAATDVLNHLFSNSLGPVAMARRIGLSLVDRIPLARRLFMREAAGATGELPRLLRGEAL